MRSMMLTSNELLISKFGPIVNQSSHSTSSSSETTLLHSDYIALKEAATLAAL